MASVGVSIMAHRKREHLVPRLVERLNITEDHVIWDRIDNRWDTGRRAMQAAAEQDCDWTCVIQDDAIVCEDLIPGLGRALDYVPEERIVQPFVGARRPIQGYVAELAARADEQGASWLEMRALNWGVIIVVPTYTVRDMLAWADRKRHPNYDWRIQQYFYSRLFWPTYYTWPNLADHMEIERDGVPSLVGHSGKHDGRVARRFAGENASALDFDWSGPVVRAKGLKSMKMRRDAAKVVAERRARASQAGRAGIG